MVSQTTELLDLKQAAERLAARGMTDLGHKGLSDQCDRGLIPYVVVARKRRVRSDVLEAMINK